MQLKNDDIFVQGPIPSEYISLVINALKQHHHIGAQDLFLGQIRNDEINGKQVQAVEYSAYEEMAIKEFETVRKLAFEQFDIEALYIYHSLGLVQKGDFSLFVLAASKHRMPVIEALPFTVEAIKAMVPIFGKEVFEDQSHVWKENK
jgi:molybdopterin synthase catalytic subunit